MIKKNEIRVSFPQNFTDWPPTLKCMRLSLKIQICRGHG